MTAQRFAQGAGAVAAVIAIGLAGMMMSARRGQAQDDGNDDESKIQQGFAIAPVPLNLAGKDRALAGLGSYLEWRRRLQWLRQRRPPTEFTATGNPYFLPPVFGGKKKVNPAT